MNHTATVLVWTTHNQKPQSTPAMEQILFTPAASWVAMTLEECGFQKFVIQGKEKEDQHLPLSLVNPKALLEWLQEKDVQDLLVLGADAPLIQKKEIKSAYDYHTSSQWDVTLFSTDNKLATGAGWYQKETLQRVVATFSEEFSLYQLLQELQDFPTVKTGRYYVEPTSILPADSSYNRACLTEVAREQIRKKHLYNDVEIPVADGVLISPTVTIGTGTTILPGCILKGNTVIGDNCEIGPDSQLENAVVGNNTVLSVTHVEDATIGNHTKIGPMCHIRPNTVIGDEIKIGNFVEVKNSTIGNKTAVSHLTYVGDSDVGESCNFGCGVVTVNYDGTNKFRTTIGDHVFVGCNCNLIAPVTLEDGVYAAAGTTITQDVPKESLVIGRVRQEVKEGRSKNYGFMNKNK